MKGDDPIKPPGHEQTVRQSKGRQSLVGAQLHFSGHEGDQIEQELDFEPDKGEYHPLVSVTISSWRSL